MNIFTQLLKPFLSTNRPQENIDFEEVPSVHDDDRPTDIRPVMFIKASEPAITNITASSLANFIKTVPDTTSIVPSAPTTTKLRKSSTSSTTSSGIIWPFGRQSNQIVPEETAAIKPQLCAIEESSESSAMISRQNSSHAPLIHPYQILSDTLYGDSDENLGDYTFHCTNISENLRPFIKKHNLVDNIQYLNTYNDIIANSNHRSISCPNMSNMPWQPPKRHGLQNSARIIPDYYFQTHHTIQQIQNESSSRLLEIDYLFIIKDDIRNMRKLNQYQIDYIQTLDDATKNEIIREFHNACNSMIETITMMRSRESSPHSSSNNLLARATDALESDHIPQYQYTVRKHIPRISSI